MKKIHVRIWSGSKCGEITEIINAGKRGKMCRVMRWGGVDYLEKEPETRPGQNAAVKATFALMVLCGKLSPECDYDAAVRMCREDLAQYPGAEVLVKIEERTIKGIDAPREKLVAGKDGVWSGHADENGISLLDHTDHYNEPAEITTRQSTSEAYRLAAKVWEKVKQAASMHEASDILTAAGCQLHGYCRMD